MTQDIMTIPECAWCNSTAKWEFKLVNDSYAKEDLGHLCGPCLIRFEQDYHPEGVEKWLMEEFEQARIL